MSSITVEADVTNGLLVITCDGEAYEMDLDTASDFCVATLDACELLGIIEPVGPRMH